MEMETSAEGEISSSNIQFQEYYVHGFWPHDCSFFSSPSSYLCFSCTLPGRQDGSTILHTGLLSTSLGRSSTLSCFQHARATAVLSPAARDAPDGHSWSLTSRRVESCLPMGGGHCTLYSSLPVRLGDGSHQGTVYSQEQIRDHLRIPPPHPPRTLRTNVNQDSETSVCCQAHSVGPHRLAARRIGSLSRCTWRGSGGASICTAALQMGNQVTLE
jgi:hypothetical protein